MTKALATSIGTVALATLIGCTNGASNTQTQGESVEESRDLLRLRLPNGVPFRNASGFAATVSARGYIDLENEFFQDLGANGRRCVSCHSPAAGWTVVPSQLQAVFEATKGGTIEDGTGAGAIFRTNDGSVSPNADVSTLSARRKAYGMLLTRGVIRIGIGVPDAAEFVLASVDDPYGYASSAELSLFRRPLPATNLTFLSAVMWDGRETFSGQTIHFDLSHQANDATLGHAQASHPLTDAQRESIVAFETSLHTAQVWDDAAELLSLAGARGGPNALATQIFYLGINDNLGDFQTHAAFDPEVFDIYDAWASRSARGVDAKRRAVARGQAIFNRKAITIRGVGGLNDNTYFGAPSSVVGTCTTCHDAPNAGNHSIAIPLDIGVVDSSRRTPDMPLYTFRNQTTGETRSVTDPGRALVTGRWADIGRFKGPILRGLPARAPYFHDGSAKDLDAVLDFYESRFALGLSAGERADLLAFLRAL